MRRVRSNFATLLVGALATTCAAPGDPVTESAAPSRPNLIVVLADDLGFRDLSCYGCEDFETPHLDALAARGVRFTQGYVTHPYCSPSRAGLLSGRYQQGFGHEHNPPYREDDNDIGIDAGTELLPSMLQRAGYACGLIGKWHVGAGEPFRPLVRGFDEFYGFLGGGHDYFVADQNASEYRGLLWRGAGPVDESITYLTDDLTTEAVSFIERHHEAGPFCLFVTYNAPHAPDQVTPEYEAMVADIEHTGRRKYAALVRGVDEGVGRIVAALSEHDLGENTMVVFLSDNGGRRGVSDNRPLRGNKGWLHEGGIRVPFIASMPGAITPRVESTPVSALDLAPTFLSAAGVDSPKELDGMNLLSWLSDPQADTPERSTFYWRVSGGEGYAMRQGRWKLVHDIAMPAPALYDLDADPAEDHDLARSRPEVLVALQLAYAEWAAGLETPRWTEGHTANTTAERARADEAGTRQFPMPWLRD